MLKHHELRTTDEKYFKWFKNFYAAVNEIVSGFLPSLNPAFVQARGLHRNSIINMHHCISTHQAKHKFIVQKVH